VFVSDELQLDPIADIDKIFVLTVVGMWGRAGAMFMIPLRKLK